MLNRTAWVIVHKTSLENAKILKVFHNFLSPRSPKKEIIASSPCTLSSYWLEVSLSDTEGGEKHNNSNELFIHRPHP